MIGKFVPLAECIMRLTGAETRQEGGAVEAALASGVRHGCGGEVLGLRAECVSMASEVLGTRGDPDVEVFSGWDCGSQV